MSAHSSFVQARFYAVVLIPAAVLMALEIVSSRVLAPRFGSSVYVWGSIIGVFLAAMSVGYAWGGRLADRRPELAGLGRLLLGSAAFQTVVLLAGRPIVAALGDATGGSPTGTLLATTLLFGPATVFLATVAPYAVKLATRDLGLLGGTAGRLYALSTAASLAGTLAATFYLVPRLELGTILRLLLALTALTAALALASAARRERLALVMAAGLVLLAFAPQRPTSDGGVRLLAERMTPYQTLSVVESGGVRYLYSDGTVHAAIDVETREPEMLYARYAPAALLVAPEARRVLALGMGGGSVGLYLERHVPGTEVELVEIDPAVPRLAQELLFFEPGPSLRVHVADARQFLVSRPEERWDYVYADTYFGAAIPFHLSTTEFFAEVERHLAPGGVFGMNLTGDLRNPFAKAMLRSLRAVYARVYIFAVPAGNYLLLATDREDAPGRGEIEARARRLDAEITIDPSFARLAEGLRQPEVDLTDALLLTDEFAPVNHLIRLDRANERWRRAPSGAMEEPDP